MHHLARWLEDLGGVEAVVERTAQYWVLVWMKQEPRMQPPLAQAESSRAPKRRKSALSDAKSLLKRFLSGELMWSFVPGSGQRSWRRLFRGRIPLVRERIHLQNQIESLLGEGRVNLSSVISELLGDSGRRIPHAMAAGETNAETLAGYQIPAKARRSL